MVRKGAWSPLFSVPFFTPFFNHICRYAVPFGDFALLRRSTFFRPLFRPQFSKGPWRLPGPPFHHFWEPFSPPGLTFWSLFRRFFRPFFGPSLCRPPTRPPHQDVPTPPLHPPHSTLSGSPARLLSLGSPRPLLPASSNYVFGRAVVPLCGLNPPAPWQGVLNQRAVPKPFHQKSV